MINSHHQIKQLIEKFSAYLSLASRGCTVHSILLEALMSRLAPRLFGQR